MILETKKANLSNLEYTELLEVQRKVSEFLKYVNSEYEVIKKMEEEHS